MIKPPKNNKNDPKKTIEYLWAQSFIAYLTLINTIIHYDDLVKFEFEYLACWFSIWNFKLNPI